MSANWDIVVPGSAVAEADGGGGGPEPPSRAAHKPLWPPNARDGLMLALAAATLVLAAGGGIGGGALLMPLYVTLGGFPPSQAVALSNLTILGGAVANLFINVQRQHPRAQGRPLIDWNLILVSRPKGKASLPGCTRRAAAAVSAAAQSGMGRAAAGSGRHCRGR